MTEVAIVDYSSNEQEIRSVRETVFILEQAVSREEEFDGKDLRCAHALARSGGLPVATGRLDLVVDGKIGRVAVLPEFRRQGIGTLVMQLLEHAAAEAGLREVWFHAQLSAVPFYRSLGYREQGENFFEAKIEHVRMSKSLSKWLE